MKKLIIAAAVCCALPLAASASPTYVAGGAGSYDTAPISSVELVFNTDAMTYSNPNNLKAGQFQASFTLQSPLPTTPCNSPLIGVCPQQFSWEPFLGNMHQFSKHCVNATCKIKSSVTTLPTQLHALTKATWLNMTGTAQLFLYDTTGQTVIAKNMNINCSVGPYNPGASKLEISIVSGGACTLELK